MHAYAWDAENRLVAVAPAGTPVEGDKRLDFKYDYRGRRVEKVYSTYDDVGEVWVAQATYRFVYDEWNVVMVLDDNNSTLRKYTWGLDLSRDHDPSRDREGAEGIHGAGGIGGLLAVEETAEQDSPAYWFFYDANGNVGQAIKASDQSIAAKYEYDPYGNVIASGGTYADANPLRFSTKWFDTELAGAQVGGAVGTSGLGYWGYRYYSPRLGRWVNRDPIEESGGMNLSGYVANNPVNNSDPKGQGCWVYFTCTLMKSTAVGKCDRDCDYLCTETNRRPAAYVGEIACEDLPKAPIVRTLGRREYGSWCCRLTRGRYGKKAVCPNTRADSQLYSRWADPQRNCSRAKCRSDCDAAYQLVNGVCGMIKDEVKKKACEVAAKAAHTSCIAWCNVWCKNP